jgi:hypothetical protein
MLNIDSKITIWDRFHLDEKSKDALMELLKERPTTTASDIFDWADENGYATCGYGTLADTGEEMSPAENKGESTLEVAIPLPKGGSKLPWANSHSGSEPPELLSGEEICAGLRQILESNGYKEGSKHARTAEYSFLQGMMFANPGYSKQAYIVLCLVSGRSILSLGSQDKKS